MNDRAEPLFTLQEVAGATGGTLLAGDPSLVLSAVSTDTRTIGTGSLYVALCGERFDGHDFISDAVSRGAAAVLTERPVDAPAGTPVVRVDRTLDAYGRLARHHRDKLGLTVVAVTGSSGKTSTKEAIAALIGRFIPTARSHANFNNEIGVPRTLLDLRAGPRCAVLEFGMRGPGEIGYLAEVAGPDIGVITNIGTAHIGRLGSQEAIARAKGELVAAMPRGRVVLNGDDPFCRSIGRDHPRVCWYSARGGKTIEGQGEEADVWATSTPVPDGEFWVFRAAWRKGPGWPAGEALVRLPLPGSHHVANTLAAMGVACQLGIVLPDDFVLAPPTVGGRSRVVAIGDIEILDESYNANPESARAALEVFCTLPSPGRRVVVFGEMAELGDYAEEAHRALGRALDGLPVDFLVTVGEVAAGIADTARVPSASCRDNAEAVRVLGSFVRSGDRLLVKGSRSGRLEEIVAGLSEWLE